LTRINTVATQIPAGTVGILVSFGTSTSANLPVGSTMTISHLLLEIATAGQTEPSAWADLDVTGKVLDIFQSGSSSGLRVQGSVLPSFTGNFSFTSTNASVTISWTGLIIVWPDSAVTTVQDGSITISGLSASTTYWAFLYFDVVYGGVALAPPLSPVGTPAQLGTSYDANADQACKQDNRVALSPGGMQLGTAASGGSGGGTGGGTGPGHPPIGCTVRGTELQTPRGPVSNIEIKERFDRGEDVFLVGRDGPERIHAAEWVKQPHFYLVAVEGYRPFGCSGSHTVKTVDGRYHWLENVPTGSPIDTTAGLRQMSKRKLDSEADVLQIELDGPSHEYQIVDGVWTHNLKIENPG
jgi:hypothetical protein